MPTIRVMGHPEEIKEICEIIKREVPGIDLEKTFETRDEGNIIRIYYRIPDELQKSAKLGLQEWMVLDYCQNVRGTSEIMRFFDLEYAEAREMLDRMHSSGILVRELFDRSYRYLDARKAVFCQDCCYYNSDELECDCRGVFHSCQEWFEADGPRSCHNYTPKSDAL